MATLTVDELRARLEALARQAPPGRKLPGAKCYSPAEPPETVRYVCPFDGSQTDYPREKADLVWGLARMRQLVKGLPGLDASLDERAMCRKCTPKGRGEVALVVEHSDGSVARTEDVMPVDLQVLKEFLEGKLEHTGSMDETSPLKDRLPRIHQLLGFSK